MYESFFGLNRRPFCFAPAVDRYFPVEAADAARAALARCIDRAEGIGLLVAGPGMGKTLLMQVLVDQFRDRFPIVQFGSGHVETRRELLQTIARGLGIAITGLDDGELRITVTEYLTSPETCPAGILILADEAHTLKFALLDELRMLTNLMQGDEPSVRLVLCGDMRLEEHLTEPRLESLNQRIVCRRYLDRFEAAETAEYIRFQIAAAGGQVEQVFEADACDKVYRAADGIPRLINQLCDFSLLLAYGNERKPITADQVDTAWAELQQIPGQWADPPTIPQLRVSNGDEMAESGVANDGVIEYGGLSDDEPEVVESMEREEVAAGPEETIDRLHVVNDEHDDDPIFAETSADAGGADAVAADEIGANETSDAATPAEDVFAQAPDDDDIPLFRNVSIFDELDDEPANEEQQPASPGVENVESVEARAQRDFDEIQGQLSDVLQKEILREQSEITEREITTGEINDTEIAESKSSEEPVEQTEAKMADVGENSPGDQPGTSTPQVAPANAESSAAQREFDAEEVVVDRYAELEAKARSEPADRPPAAKHVMEIERPEAAPDMQVPVAMQASPSDPEPEQRTDESPAAALPPDEAVSPNALSQNALSQNALSHDAPSQNNDEPESDLPQIQMDDGRLQVFVDPYGDLFSDDADEEFQDVEALDDVWMDGTSLDPTKDAELELADSAGNGERERASDDSAAGDRGEIEEIALPPSQQQAQPHATPPMAVPKSNMRALPSDFEATVAPSAAPSLSAAQQPPISQSPSAAREIRLAPSPDELPHAEKQETPLPADPLPTRPLLLIEDEDETDSAVLDVPIIGPAGAEVRIDDYESLFARLKGQQPG